jgi:hypothetical protein
MVGKLNFFVKHFDNPVDGNVLNLLLICFLILRLFRRKIISVVKYFRRNYFQAFSLHEKITKGENATVVGI